MMDRKFQSDPSTVPPGDPGKLPNAAHVFLGSLRDLYLESFGMCGEHPSQTDKESPKGPYEL